MVYYDHRVLYVPRIAVFCVHSLAWRLRSLKIPRSYLIFSVTPRKEMAAVAVVN